jgi:Ca2+-binding EF-hand superfamily protein
MFKAFDVN